VVIGALVVAFGSHCAPAPSAEGNQPHARLGRIVEKLEPGVWHEIPDTTMRSVLMSKKESQPAAWGRGGSIYMTKSHMGCTFDGRRLYMMGGGDKAYGGNEIYMFDLETLAWSRLTEPSLLNTPEGEDGPCAGYASDADGNPAPPAMKVYDGLVYHPGRHALYLWGRNPYCYKRHGGGRTHTWRFDLQD
jgi:hypothetical protein